MREMLEEANRNQLSVIREMCEAARAAVDQDDPGTVDLFSRTVQVTRSTNGGPAISFARTTA